MRLAIASYIHGNPIALDVVAADTARRGIDRIVHRGRPRARRLSAGQMTDPVPELRTGIHQADSAPRRSLQKTAFTSAPW